MELVHVRCFICGAKIGYDVEWQLRFRAVLPGLGDPYVTGVGFQDNDSNASYEWQAPTDPDAALSRTNDNNAKGADTVKVDAREHFVAHDACWSLLTIARPREIPVSRLYQVLYSSQELANTRGICLEHTFGGIFDAEDEHVWPWEFDLLDPLEHLEGPKEGCFSEHDPLSVRALSTILHSRRGHQRRSVPQIEKSADDCFGRLPWEICEEIAVLLPTRAALDLRLVSAAFLPLLESHSFWLRRFEMHGQLGHVFEARNTPNAELRYIYRRVRRLAPDSIPGLSNRKRIWPLVLSLLDLTDLRLSSASESESVDLLADRSLSWRHVMANIQHDMSSDHVGDFEKCRSFDAQCAAIPPDLAALVVFLVAEQSGTYITGIGFETATGQRTTIGYVSTNAYRRLSVTMITGFSVALGGRGIRALKVHHHSGSSEWLGNASCTPITERLTGMTGLGPVKCIEVKFDGYKLVGLSVATGKTLSFIKTPSLRESGIWYPGPPPEDVTLNDCNMTGVDPAVGGFVPLIWLRFGGDRGADLRRLCKITVRGMDFFNNIEFCLRKEGVPDQESSDNESRHGSDDGDPEKWHEYHMLGRRRQLQTDRDEFDIDGKAGETIEKLELGWGNDGDLACPGKLEVTTNRGRVDGFPRLIKCDFKRMTLPIVHGETLTGLYGCQHPATGFLALGAISERLTPLPS